MAGDDFFFGRELESDGGFAVVEVGFDFFEDFGFGDGGFVAALGVFGEFLDALLDVFQIGDSEFGGDGFDVANGIDGTGNVMDVFVFETADDLDDGIDFADVAEELVAQAFALGGAFDEAGDVHEFDGGGDDDGGFGDLFKDLEAGVGDSDDADVGVDGAEGVVGGLGFARACDGVEEGGFSNVGQTDYSSFEHKTNGEGKAGKRRRQGATCGVRHAGTERCRQGWKMWNLWNCRGILVEFLWNFHLGVFRRVSMIGIVRNSVGLRSCGVSRRKIGITTKYTKYTKRAPSWRWFGITSNQLETTKNRSETA